MKVSVDLPNCMGNGLCAMVAPEVFQLRDDGLVEVLLPNPPETLREAVEEAARMCPTAAITIEE